MVLLIHFYQGGERGGGWVELGITNPMNSVLFSNLCDFEQKVGTFSFSTSNSEPMEKKKEKDHQL